MKKIILSGTAPPNRAMKHMRQAISELTKEQHALLKVYIHGRQSHAFESISMIIQPPPVYKRQPLFTYCAECQSCRSKFVTSKGVSKRLHGLEVNLNLGEAFCSACETTRVQVTLLNTFIFTTRYVNRAIYNLTFCSACYVLTADVKVVGEKLLCKHCFKTHKQRQVAGPCEFCPYAATHQFVGTKAGKASWVNVCDNHKHILPRVWGVSVEALLTLNNFCSADTPQRYHGTRKRSRESILRLPRN